MTTRSTLVLVTAVALALAGCDRGDDEAVPSVLSPAETVADAVDAAPATTEPTESDDAVVATTPPATIAIDETSESVATSQPEPVTTEPPATEPVDDSDESSTSPVSAAEIADLERQLDEIDALLTDLEFDLDQD